MPAISSHKYNIECIEPNEGLVNTPLLITMYLTVDSTQKIDLKWFNNYHFVLFQDKQGGIETARRVPITFSILNPDHPNIKGAILLGTHKFPSCPERKKIFVGLIDDEDNELLERKEFNYTDVIQTEYDYGIDCLSPSEYFGF